MTAIAYRDGVLAADSRANQGALIISSRSKKIARRTDGWLIGVAGECAAADEFMARFIAGDNDWRPPGITKAEDGFQALLIAPDGLIWNAHESGRFRIDADFAAEGSATNFLFGAMAAGASAEEAVRLACLFRGDCGLPVQSVRLENF